MIGKFLPAVLIALAEIILIPAMIFPLFYQYASPLLGCSPVGNGSLFNINIFSNSKIGTVCPVSIPIYYYLLAVLIIAMAIFYFIGSSFSDYFYLVVNSHLIIRLLVKKTMPITATYINPFTRNINPNNK